MNTDISAPGRIIFTSPYCYGHYGTTVEFSIPQTTYNDDCDDWIYDGRLDDIYDDMYADISDDIDIDWLNNLLVGSDDKSIYDIDDKSIYGKTFCDKECNKHASICDCTQNVKMILAQCTMSHSESNIVNLILEYYGFVYLKKNMAD